jgi:hypothetical protein
VWKSLQHVEEFDMIDLVSLLYGRQQRQRYFEDLQLQHEAIGDAYDAAHAEMEAYKHNGGQPIGPGKAGWLIGMIRHQQQHHTAAVEHSAEAAAGPAAQSQRGAQAAAEPAAQSQHDAQAAESAPQPEQDAAPAQHVAPARGTLRQPVRHSVRRQAKNAAARFLDIEAAADCADDSEEDSNEDDEYEPSFIDDRPKEDD